MANNKLTLFEEMKRILNNSSHPMTPEELSNEINRANLYVRTNGQPVTKSQIMAAVRKYRLLFSYNGSIISTSC